MEARAKLVERECVREVADYPNPLPKVPDEIVGEEKQKKETPARERWRVRAGNAENKCRYEVRGRDQMHNSWLRRFERCGSTRVRLVSALEVNACQRRNKIKSASITTATQRS